MSTKNLETPNSSKSNPKKSQEANEPQTPSTSQSSATAAPPSKDTAQTAKADTHQTMSATPPPITEPTATANIVPTPAGNSNSPLLVGMIAMTFILVLAAIAVVFLVWQELNKVGVQAQQVTSQFEALESRVNNQVGMAEDTANQVKRTVNSELDRQKSQLTQDISRLDGQVKDFAGDILTQNRTLAQFSEDLDKTQRGLQTLSGEKQTQWSLNEAYYLVKMAGQNLFIMKDMQTGLALLELAEKRIAEQKDTNLNYVREAITKDIAAIKNLPWVDSEGIVLSLEALIPQIEDMPLLSMQLPEDNTTDMNVAEQVTGWRARVNRVLEEIKREWIVVRHHDEKVEPLLTPEEYTNLKHNLILVLQKAQIAAFKQHQALYDQHIETALSWLKGFFQHNAEVAQKLTASLEALSEKSVTQTLPEKLESNNVLASLLANRAASRGE
ncbi:MAG: uroporphyrinogen-III C-methyltransferase [Pseudomonadota bacterium]